MTKAQRDVLEKMRDGWELRNECFDFFLSKGTRIRMVSRRTVRSLRDRLLVSVVRNRRAYPTGDYQLTPAGRAAVETKETK